MVDPREIEEALGFISPSIPRDEWATVAMAVKSELPDSSGFELFDAWSQQGDNYDKAACRDTYRSVRSGGGITIGSLFHMAKQGGWVRTVHHMNQRPPKAKKNDSRERQQAKAEILCTGAKARQIWALTTPAPDNHPYLVRKQIQPHGIGVLGQEFKHLPRRVRHDGNVLVIPKRAVHGGEVVSLQFVSDNDKAYLLGRQPKGTVFQIGKISDGFYVCEGFATGASIHQDSGEAVFVAFDTNGLLPAGLALRLRYPKATIIFMADDDWQTTGNPGITRAKQAAVQVQAKVCVPPFDGVQRAVKDTDFNDYVRLRHESGR